MFTSFLFIIFFCNLHSTDIFYSTKTVFSIKRYNSFLTDYFGGLSQHIATWRPGKVASCCNLVYLHDDACICDIASNFGDSPLIYCFVRPFTPLFHYFGGLSQHIATWRPGKAASCCNLVYLHDDACISDIGSKLSDAICRREKGFAMDCSSFKSTVLESYEEEFKRDLVKENADKFNSREEVDAYAGNMYYSRRAHDLDFKPERGYTVFYDTLFDRNIYITSKQVGFSHVFHVEFAVESMFNLLKHSTNHEDYHDMGKATRKWWIDNMKFVALQLAETRGNVVLFCTNGRTRSPMYVVVYLMMIHSMSINNAMTTIRELLMSQRGYELDRHRSLLPMLNDIFSIV